MFCTNGIYKCHLSNCSNAVRLICIYINPSVSFFHTHPVRTSINTSTRQNTKEKRLLKCLLFRLSLMLIVVLILVAYFAAPICLTFCLDACAYCLGLAKTRLEISEHKMKSYICSILTLYVLWMKPD